MKKLRRGIGLALVATVAGLALQCASDPAIVGDGGVIDGWLADLGLSDTGARDARRDARGADGAKLDSIGPKADAAPTPTDWFTMTYARNGGSADKLLAPGSDVSVGVGHVFDTGKLGKLVPAVGMLTLGVWNASTVARVYLQVTFKGVVAPATVGVSGLTTATASETERTTAGMNKTLFVCSWTAAAPTACQPTGTFTFTKVGTALVAGSYALTFDDGAGQKRTLSGQFEAVPAAEPAELKP